MFTCVNKSERVRIFVLGLAFHCLSLSDLIIILKEKKLAKWAKAKVIFFKCSVSKQIKFFFAYMSRQLGKVLWLFSSFNVYLNIILKIRIAFIVVETDIS